ncbi:MULTISPECIES: glycosyltransferase family 4 protein [Streptomycetaceae]|uniref:D-inositol 3-phosphate glycosyltransferase n=1 Tax=Streptantibioticus cattleyicolor (strain ATCC 35852 / DSM 46488 / JCM 4925 / NBRC 14057 / NRRL 8057) TaxID=1003195 RepID=F8K165_STREN|nr:MULTISPECIES: glycosyltransferase family 4 protein [Streptomycetaceae]AEW96136.1 glycosyl transferase, group 1 [Streptantibioticus cattleyicolor NRRL 8057 = DSM 46488]MYS60664.1 glycosyltransferase [Streptomyces sp. SID5468]CCB76474.1 Glycosyl transferase group 1 [Streptantibioticus cattleyicolor NRRL 8057 = DSM 46488]
MGSAPRKTARIAVLADTGLGSDARAYRVARSAAEDGYEVSLIGRADGHWPPAPPGVTVHAVEVAETLHRHRLRRPRPGLRWPLAYRCAEAYRYRLAQLALRDHALRTRSAELGVLYRPLARQAAARTAHALLRLWHAARRGWTLARAAQYRAAVRRRATPDRFLDNAATALARLLLGRRAWRRLDPLLLDLETAYGPLLDALRPHLVHARGRRVLGVALRAQVRAAAAGHSLKVVWDADECAALTPAPSRRAAAARDADERAHAPGADAVVTVGDAYADHLRLRHRLPEAPAVVLDSPPYTAGTPAPGPDGGVRARCHLGPDVPLLVHSGGTAPERGLLTAVEALPKLYDLHAAFVVPDPGAPHVRELTERAARLGVASRLHVLEYVPAPDVPAFLASADIGVAPVHHLPHHEVTLPARYLEYAHARLPVVVSDVRAMAAATLELGNGEVFRAGDTADFVRAVGAVLTNRPRYRKAYERSPELLRQWSWQTQSAELMALYRRLLAGDRGL